VGLQWARGGFIFNAMAQFVYGPHIFAYLGFIMGSAASMTVVDLPEIRQVAQ
jgi:hypothetical protein